MKALLDLLELLLPPIVLFLALGVVTFIFKFITGA